MLINYVCKRYINTNKYMYFYTILKVKPEATAREIKDSYFKLSKIYHPDNMNSGNESKFMSLKNAYEMIKEAPLITNKIETQFEEEFTFQDYHESHNYVHNPRYRADLKSYAPLYQFAHEPSPLKTFFANTKRKLQGKGDDPTFEPLGEDRF